MIDPQTMDRWFGVRHALAAPAVGPVVGAIVFVLAAFPFVLKTAGKNLEPKLRDELWQRYRSWMIIIPLMIGPILLGAAATIVAVAILSLICYREFARATGMFRWPLTSGPVVIGLLAVAFSVADHWYNLFTALAPLTILLIASVAILADNPKGYIQRVALGVLAFLLFGICFGHLAYFANDSRYRSILVWLVCCVELNDIFAFTCGKLFGRRKLAPNTSPNKTVGGSLGAIACTTTVTALLGRLAFGGTMLASPVHLIAMGLILSATAQLGDLTLSSVKRDLNIKDWSNLFPGHGGLLDRFNSLLFAAPAIFHYIGYFTGVGLDQPARVLSGHG